ncbi:MAG: cupin-like domain-containing protein, partial [Polyangiaceae bacterium]
SPVLASCARLFVERERRDQLLRLMAELRGELTVERRDRLTAHELFATHWEGNAPVVLTEAIADWPALSRWSFADFRSRLGEVEVEVCTGRDGDPEPDRNFADHLETMPLSRYLDLLEDRGESNDLYMIAHNRTMERPEMAVLFDDIRLDESIFDPEQLYQGCTLWLGPAGTLTPLHHDSTNILFCQIVGRKRVWLIPPYETSLLDDMRGFYASFDPRRPREQWPVAHRDVQVAELVLEPGEALFLPAGWWHQIEALEPSISFSLLCFRRHNRFDEYAPGKTKVVSRRETEG